MAPAVVDGFCWGGGILPMGTLITNLLLTGPMAGAGVLSTTPGGAVLVPGRSAKGGKILHC